MISVLDRLYATIANRRPLFYAGWGDVALLHHLMAGNVAFPRGMIRNINWLDTREVENCIIKLGQFPSPAADLGLPCESEQAYVEWIMPRHANASTPVVIHFAATGDEGFAWRRIAFALPLIQIGIGSLILENPYYGLRRPAGQEGKVLPYVSDLWKMGLATTVEGLALGSWLKEEGYRVQIACGISMGGHIAAKVAGFSEEPMGCVAFIAPHSAEAVYLEGQLRHYVAWEALQREPLGDGSVEDFFRAILSRTDIRHCPRPRYMQGVAIVGARNDAYIPPRSVLTLHRHWPEAKLQWVSGGHVGAVVFHRRCFLSIVSEIVKAIGT